MAPYAVLVCGLLAAAVRAVTNVEPPRLVFLTLTTGISAAGACLVVVCAIYALLERRRRALSW